MKTYTAEEIKKLKTFNSNTADKQYRIRSEEASIVVDNHNGIGSSQATREIFYKGFVAEVAVKHLAVLCGETTNATDSSNQLVELIKAGESVANPVVYLDIENFIAQTKGNPEVMGHDNYDAALAMLTLGCDKVPVQFALVGYKGSLVKNDKFFYNWINRSILNQNKSKSVSNIFERIIFG